MWFNNKLNLFLNYEVINYFFLSTCSTFWWALFGNVGRQSCYGNMCWQKIWHSRHVNSTTNYKLRVWLVKPNETHQKLVKAMSEIHPKRCEWHWHITVIHNIYNIKQLNYLNLNPIYTVQESIAINYRFWAFILLSWLFLSISETSTDTSPSDAVFCDVRGAAAFR